MIVLELFLRAFLIHQCLIHLKPYTCYGIEVFLNEN